MMRLDPWNAEQAIDWNFVKSEWTRFAEEAGKSVFVEASPPNIIRVEDVMKAFASDMKAVFAISNPYMQIASSVKNYAKRKITTEVLEEFAQAWLNRAEYQMRNVSQHADRFPLVKYEAFCRDPQLVNTAFGLAAEPLARLGGKRNSQVGKIMEMSAKNISFLTVFETEIVTAALEKRQDILDFFDYKLLDFDGYEQILRDKPALTNAGLVDRIKWENRQLKRGRTPD